MKKLAIKAENISKQYRLGEVGTGTLSHDLNRLWSKLRGKEDPYLKIGEANNRASKGESDYVWSLRDINFEIEQGDAVGIIGRNGAGKSTLLKLLSKVTKPTTGSFKLNGRIASLLEVGTGFNPEMTGRENIYLNGAILGMRRHEISRKLDEIVDFAGVERYIDTPVKRYSSGMYVRLAFAVAAHLESEILIVDEVLAVGDAEFQKKCLGKMGNVSKGEGRTVLFVSHNMAAVSSLCARVITLQNGCIVFDGDVNNAIGLYLNYKKDDINNDAINEFIQIQNDEFFVLKSISLNQDGLMQNNFYASKEILITIKYGVIKEVLGLRIGFDLIDLTTDVVIFRSFLDDIENKINISNKGDYVIRTAIPKKFLKNGKFGIKLAIGIHNVRWIIFDDNIILRFNVVNIDGLNSAYNDSRPGFLMPQLDWRYIDDLNS
jgi:lipopolysaccharide transport system ATP-binding protein